MFDAEERANQEKAAVASASKPRGLVASIIASVLGDPVKKPVSPATGSPRKLLPSAPASPAGPVFLGSPKSARHVAAAPSAQPAAGSSSSPSHLPAIATLSPGPPSTPPPPVPVQSKRGKQPKETATVRRARTKSAVVGEEDELAEDEDLYEYPISQASATKQKGKLNEEAMNEDEEDEDAVDAQEVDVAMHGVVSPSERSTTPPAASIPAVVVSPSPAIVRAAVPTTPRPTAASSSQTVQQRSGTLPMTPVSVAPKNSAARMSMREKERLLEERRAESDGEQYLMLDAVGSIDKGKRKAHTDGESAQAKRQRLTSPFFEHRSAHMAMDPLTASSLIGESQTPIPGIAVTPTREPAAAPAPTSTPSRPYVESTPTPSRNPANMPWFDDLQRESAKKRRLAKEMAKVTFEFSPNKDATPVNRQRIQPMGYAAATPSAKRYTERATSPIESDAVPGGSQSSNLGVSVPNDSPGDAQDVSDPATQTSDRASSSSQSGQRRPLSASGHTSIHTELTRAPTEQSLLSDSNHNDIGYGQQEDDSLLYDQYGFGGMVAASQAIDGHGADETPSAGGSRAAVSRLSSQSGSQSQSQDSIFRPSELAPSQSPTSAKQKGRTQPLRATTTSHPEGPLLTAAALGSDAGSQDPWASSQPGIPLGARVDRDVGRVADFMEADVWKF